MAAIIEVPTEGLKLICIAGTTTDGAAIWKQAGVITIGKGGKPTIMIDKTFNPAGANDGSGKNNTSIILTAVPYSKDEIDRKGSYQAAVRKPPSYHQPRHNTEDDDTPF